MQNLRRITALERSSRQQEDPARPRERERQAKCSADSREHSRQYHGFLPKKLALARQDHLHICTNTLVTKIDIGILPDGARMTRGVQVLDSQTGHMKKIRASREVIVCAGPLVSPQILMLRWSTAHAIYLDMVLTLLPQRHRTIGAP